MPQRPHPPVGAPCWTDLWTSDVDRSRAFYAELFGWEAQEPSEEFGGYFMFMSDGIPVAGAMGAMAGAAADNRWKVYLCTDDLAKATRVAEEHGGVVTVPPMAVADLGSQVALKDPAGATFGMWQPGTFPGFTVLDEPSFPSWFELWAPDHRVTVDFYRSVFGWETVAMSDTDEFRYTAAKVAGADTEVAGVMDTLSTGAPAEWFIYWEVGDIAAAVASVRRLGGSVTNDVMDTPYGKMAAVTDPTGAPFRLRMAP